MEGWRGGPQCQGERSEGADNESVWECGATNKPLSFQNIFYCSKINFTENWKSYYEVLSFYL